MEARCVCARCQVCFVVASQSTGDSLDEDDKETEATRRNTSYNEVIDADNPQTPEEVSTPCTGALWEGSGTMRS